MLCLRVEPLGLLRGVLDFSKLVLRLEVRRLLMSAGLLFAETVLRRHLVALRGIDANVDRLLI